MKLIHHGILLFFCFSFASLISSLSGPVDQLADTTAYMVCRVPEEQTIGNVTYEVWLRIPNTTNLIQKTIEKYGTGFFVQGQKFTYLVTAKHIAEIFGVYSYATVSINGVSTQVSALGLTGTNSVNWINHPLVDLSILRLTPPTHKQFLFRRVAVGNMDVGTNQPSRDLIYTVLGFPLALGTTSGFSPLARESKAASGFMTNDTGAFFILQNPSVQGFSGAPLFEASFVKITPGGLAVGGGGQFTCMGIMTATLRDDTGGKMARIVPAFYIRELIEMDEAQDFKAATLQKEQKPVKSSERQ
jgi:hypothetical protein